MSSLNEPLTTSLHLFIYLTQKERPRVHAKSIIDQRMARAISGHGVPMRCNQRQKVASVIALGEIVQYCDKRGNNTKASNPGHTKSLDLSGKKLQGIDVSMILVPVHKRGSLRSSFRVRSGIRDVYSSQVTY